MNTTHEITTTIIRRTIERRLVDEDLSDDADAVVLAYNRGIDDAVHVALEEGDPILAALIRRQRQ